MPTFTSIMIYIGNYPDADPNEASGNYVAELATAVFKDVIVNNSVMKMTTMTLYDNVPGSLPNIIGDNDHGGLGSGGDTVTYNVGSGVTTQITDSTIGASVTLTLGDGSTVTKSVLIIQMANGDSFITENDVLNNGTSLDNLSIQSITINSIIEPNYSGFYVWQTINNSLVVCFSDGTLIATDRGEVAVEALEQGDLVLTRDDGFRPVRWIGMTRFDAAALERTPHLRPIRILAGALGNGLPTADLLVSPQHRVLIVSTVAERMFGEREVLVAAKHLTALPGIEVAEDVTEVEYWHFLLDRHQVVFSNGAATESLYTGPEALRSVPPEAREEILSIFPQLADLDHTALPDPARLLVPGRRARRFAERIAANGKQLVA